MKDMKVEDLRIGNLVRVNNPQYRPNDTGKTLSILKIDSENDSINGVCIEDMPYAVVFGQFLKHIEPIPLTPDQLPKLGFNLSKRKSGTQGVYSNGKMNVILSNSGNVYTTKNKLIPDVHTFQNVYYFHLLTSEELTHKP